MNPDDCCIPLLTALGDIFGALLLYLCFYLVYLSGDKSAKVIEISTNITKFFNETSFTTSLIHRL
jgi:hypothetical protein